MDLKLKGKKALVLGSSTGIGKAIAQSLISEGADVLISSRTQTQLEKTFREIKAQDFEVCDYSKVGETTRLVRSAIQKLGGLDILVTNTGGPKRGHFAEISQDQWHHDFQSVWMSVVEALNTALPHMKEKKFGRVLLVTSVAAKQPLPALTTSNGLRAGLTGLAKSVSTEYGQFGVTINLLLPGYTNTDRIKGTNLSEDMIRQMVPVGRIGEPHELADLAAFLASPRAGYITGQSIAVDGGFIKGH